MDRHSCLGAGEKGGHCTQPWQSNEHVAGNNPHRYALFHCTTYDMRTILFDARSICTIDTAWLDLRWSNSRGYRLL